MIAKQTYMFLAVLIGLLSIALIVKGSNNLPIGVCYFVLVLISSYFSAMAFEEEI